MSAIARRVDAGRRSNPVRHRRSGVASPSARDPIWRKMMEKATHSSTRCERREHIMWIAIAGAVNVGQALGKGSRKAGHDVAMRYAPRPPNKVASLSADGSHGSWPWTRPPARRGIRAGGSVAGRCGGALRRSGGSPARSRRRHQSADRQARARARPRRSRRLDGGAARVRRAASSRPSTPPAPRTWPMLAPLRRSR